MRSFSPSEYVYRFPRKALEEGLKKSLPGWTNKRAEVVGAGMEITSYPVAFRTRCLSIFWMLT
jgi:hypothetical protein